ncbi:cupin domain-containing protein [Nocardia sp. CDC153]|uniref:cupin domain-containing protein n=1 Tax=Nocardia sp. CDC153 TaxID=3112167 RepID=UPI002DB873DF|nr:cupin domain-containing protein [Nocardia sp. CDC153]MEC3956421.1 cupin domain-containing protein [Nocardia sp. CDC153]
MTSVPDFPLDLPIFEIYSGADGARIEIHPWFFVEGRQYLGVTRVLPPGTGKGPAHIHLGTTQYCLLLEGARARFRRGRRSGILEPGEVLTIPADTPHVDPYNDSDQPIVLRTLYTPGPVWLLAFGRTLGQAIRDRQTNGQQELRLLHLLMMLGTPGSVTYAASIPVPVQRRLLLPLATRVAKQRGYRPAAGLRDHIFRTS